MTDAEYHQAWVSVLSFEELLPLAERCWGAIPNAHVGDQAVVNREALTDSGTSSS